MKVKAYKLGFYDHKRRREGSVFHLKSDSDFSFDWMMKYDADKNAFLKLVKPKVLKEEEEKKEALAKAQAEKAKLVAKAEITEVQSADIDDEPIDIAVEQEASSDDEVI